MANYTNTDGYIKISFESIPHESIRIDLKNMGFRWDVKNKEWYAQSTNERIELVENICKESVNNKLHNKMLTPVKQNKRYCYCNTIEMFLNEEQNLWLKKMETTFHQEYTMPLGEPQIRAWEDCFKNLKDQLNNLTESQKKTFHIIFEYALPYEGGRRPDVIILSKELVIILEYKQKSQALESDLDQLVGYVRDIQEYHFESREKRIISALVLTGRHDNHIEEDITRKVTICSGNGLANFLTTKIDIPITICEPNDWINSKYEPLPTIVESAKMIMENEELPNIRRVNSTGIPQAINFLSELAQNAENNKQHILALVTGVPGAGKTFLGLNFVHNVCKSNEEQNSIYLTGNGPLACVLIDALGKTPFVKNVHTVVDEYINKKIKSFNKNIIVFDEGQRAWDIDRMSEKKYINQSEPDIFIEIADKLLDWSMLVVLVGEGQEIHLGESGGIKLWNDALNKSRIHNWKVVCPKKLENYFPEQIIETNDDLDLNTSLRSYLASDVSAFVNLLIEGQINEAKKLVKGIKEAGFSIYITRDVERAKKYCLARYENTNKKYGLIASSKATTMKPMFRVEVANWFNADSNDQQSCCSLKIAISEFHCQGLEIDFPIVGWSTDMIWDGNKWCFSEENTETKTYRSNSYRVLLTRGRDGFIIYVPNKGELDLTFELFNNLGLEILE